jgi:hypothetical protein
METLNFSEQFAQAVEAGIKLQTIRRSEKGLRAGDKIKLCTESRTLGVGIIQSVRKVILFEDFCAFCKNNYTLVDMSDRVARADGFATYKEFTEWFRNYYKIADLDENPFEGFMHAWTLIKDEK